MDKKTEFKATSDMNDTRELQCGGLQSDAECESRDTIFSADKDEQTITLPMIFADGMVFQRQMPINIFGYGKTDGMIVKASLSKNGEVISSATGAVKNGEFIVTLPSLEAQFGLTLSVEVLGAASGQAIKCSDINVGEVWISSGQSNADAVKASHMEDMAEYALNADNFKNIRLYTQRASRAAYADKIGTNATWHKLNSSAFNKVGAVGYVAIAKISAFLGENIPIAIIHAAHSSSIISPWISEEEFIILNERAKSNSHINCEWEYAYTQTEKDLRYTEAFKKYYDTYGAMPTGTDEDKERFFNLTSLGYRRADWCSAGACYNALFAHMRGFSARGVIWYQGESDIGRNNIESYPLFFDALMKTFKTTFNNDEMPFIIMQISPYGICKATDDSLDEINAHARFKATQEKMSRELKNTFIVSTATDGSRFSYSDLVIGGAPAFIHPAIKSPLGIRAANIILSEVYGLCEKNQAPRPLGAKKDGEVLTITFDSELFTFFGFGALGFELSGEEYLASDGSVLSAKYESSWYSVVGELRDSSVIIKIPDGKAPKSVRYAHGSPLIELRDGRLIEYTYTTNDLPLGKMIDAEDIESAIPAKIPDARTGEHYTFHPLGKDAVRMLSYGNITNESGEPAPLFCIEID